MEPLGQAPPPAHVPNALGVYIADVGTPLNQRGGPTWAGHVDYMRKRSARKDADRKAAKASGEMYFSSDTDDAGDLRGAPPRPSWYRRRDAQGRHPYAVASYHRPAAGTGDLHNAPSTTRPPGAPAHPTAAIVHPLGPAHGAASGRPSVYAARQSSAYERRDASDERRAIAPRPTADAAPKPRPGFVRRCWQRCKALCARLLVFLGVRPYAP